MYFFKNHIILKFIVVFFSFTICACNKPTYTEKTIADSVKTRLKQEYNISDVKINHKKNTLWLYTPVEKLVDDKFELHKEALTKIGNVSQVASRIVFSSDSNIEFIAMFANDSSGVELKMFRNIEDIKKVQAWYISHSDFYSRMDINLGFNPSILGKRVVKDIYEILNSTAPKNKKSISKYFTGGISDKEMYGFPRGFGKIEKLYSLRLEQSKALVYLKTKYPDEQLLFLVDVEFFDILKQLLILYLTKGESNEKSESQIGLPIISKFWDLSKEDWPYDYKKHKNIKKWGKDLYSKEISFKQFIAQQIERRLRKFFEEDNKDWKIKFRDINVTYLRDEILVTRDMKLPFKKVVDIDVDREIYLILAKVLKSYDLEDVKTVTISTSDWADRKTLEREDILKIKKTKPVILIKKEIPGAVSIKDILLEIFVPNYTGKFTVDDEKLDKNKSSDKYNLK